MTAYISFMLVVTNLPVENIELLSRYGSNGGDAPLDRLGGVAWQARVARIKGRVRIMAEQLSNIALHDIS